MALKLASVIKRLNQKRIVKLLVIELKNKLHFDPQISDLCTTHVSDAAIQLNVPKRRNKFDGFEERKTLVQKLFLF